MGGCDTRVYTRRSGRGCDGRQQTTRADIGGLLLSAYGRAVVISMKERPQVFWGRAAKSAAIAHAAQIVHKSSPNHLN